jgi:ABC-2 type transport system permease protein
MLSAGIASGVSAMIMTRFGLTAFSMEGRAYWVLKGAPIRRRDLVLGKFLVAYLPYLALGGLLVVFLEGARAVSDARLFDAPLLLALGQTVDPLLLLYAWFVVAATGAGAIGLTLALGAARPNLRWDTPHEMLTPDLGCLSLVLYGGYGAVAGLLLALPMAVSRFEMLQGGAAVWAVGLTLGLALTAVTTLGGLWVAAGELDAIGE